MANFPPHVIERSELRVLPRSPNGECYQLHVGLPPSYEQNATRRYPVVFLSDGYWSFPMVAKMRDLLFFDGTVPEFVVVGLGYVGENLDYDKKRWSELSPVAVKGDVEVTGNGAEFLREVVATMVPFIEAEYRIDPSFRVLMGSSLGGLFSLFAAYARPGFFHAYIAATPAVTIGDDWIFGFEEKFVASGQTLRGRLYLSIGSEEAPLHREGVERFDRRIRSRKSRELSYRCDVIPGMRHCGGIFEAFVRGLSFVFLEYKS